MQYNKMDLEQFSIILSSTTLQCVHLQACPKLSGEFPVIKILPLNVGHCVQRHAQWLCMPSTISSLGFVD